MLIGRFGRHRYHRPTKDFAVKCELCFCEKVVGSGAGFQYQDGEQRHLAEPPRPWLMFVALRGVKRENVSAAGPSLTQRDGAAAELKHRSQSCETGRCSPEPSRRAAINQLINGRRALRCRELITQGNLGPNRWV